jgi:glutaredoxin
MVEESKKDYDIEIIMYTMSNCMFCKKLKDKLTEEGIEYVEKDNKEHEAEWSKVKMLTGIPVFPTLKIDGRYYCPNRDFKSDEDALALIKGIEIEPAPDVTLELLYENLKTTRTQFENITQQFGIIIQECRRMSGEIATLTASVGNINSEGLRDQISKRNNLIIEEQLKGNQIKKDLVNKQQNV